MAGLVFASFHIIVPVNCICSQPRILQDAVSFASVDAACVAWLHWTLDWRGWLRLTCLHRMFWEMVSWCDDHCWSTMTVHGNCLICAVTAALGFGWTGNVECCDRVFKDAFIAPLNFDSRSPASQQSTASKQVRQPTQAGQYPESSGVHCGVETHAMPVTILGSGRSGLSSKFAALIHVSKLEVSGSDPRLHPFASLQIHGTGVNVLCSIFWHYVDLGNIYRTGQS